MGLTATLLSVIRSTSVLAIIKTRLITVIILIKQMMWSGFSQKLVCITITSLPQTYFLNVGLKSFSVLNDFSSDCHAQWRLGLTVWCNVNLLVVLCCKCSQFSPMWEIRKLRLWGIILPRITEPVSSEAHVSKGVIQGIFLNYYWDEQ